MVEFAGNWNVVKDLSSIKTGITVHAENNTFYVSNLNLGKSVSISMGDFVFDSYKYRNEILYTLLSKVNGVEKKEHLYLDSKACELIDQLCESNRLLY